MAEANLPRRPRIRKSAPTIRELSEKARVQPAAGRQPKRRLRRLALAPLGRVKKSDNRFTRLIGKTLRPVKRILSWLVPSYFINSWRELKQVTWPGRRETWRLTAAVFVFAIIFGIAIYGVDYALDKIFKETVIN